MSIDVKRLKNMNHFDFEKSTCFCCYYCWCASGVFLFFLFFSLDYVCSSAKVQNFHSKHIARAKQTKLKYVLAMSVRGLNPIHKLKIYESNSICSFACFILESTNKMRFEYMVCYLDGSKDGGRRARSNCSGNENSAQCIYSRYVLPRVKWAKKSNAHNQMETVEEREKIVCWAIELPINTVYIKHGTIFLKWLDHFQYFIIICIEYYAYIHMNPWISLRNKMKITNTFATAKVMWCNAKQNEAK